tara:strand:+ start:524 stop:1585 length:1062 start_codon:yes stop_codon:yes gene_type:complete
MISFILPIRNEAKFISKTINSILYQKFDGRDFEIIISDGESDDGTIQIVEELEKKHKKIKLINNPNKISASGFNKALTICMGEIIIRVDGHVELAKDYIENYYKIIKKVDADCIGGRTIHIGLGVIGNSIRLAQSSKFGVGGALFRQKLEIGSYVDTLAFGAYKREVFQKFGSYDEDLIKNQDDEFNFRINQNNKKIWLDPSLISYYVTRDSIFKLFSQYFQYGFYKVRVIQKRRGIASWRHIVPAIFCSLLIFGFFNFIINKKPIFFISLFMSYTIANLFATFYELVKKPKNILSMLMLPVTYFVLHISYGIGFLCGGFYFLNKWNDIKINSPSFNKEIFKFNGQMKDGKEN